MTAKILVALACIALLAPVSSYAQATDMAAERARIANQRIEAETQSRVEEEEERLRQVETPSNASAETTAAPQAVRPAPQPASEPRPAPSPATASEIRPTTRSAVDMERLLEQLRDLGALRDAGYVTDDEFHRIKQRILDQSL